MIDFTGISRASIVGRALRLPLRLLPAGMKVRIVQGPLRGRRWIVGAGVHGYWLGSYERDKQELFLKTIKPGDRVYDIGANVGFYTLLAAQQAGSSGRVCAFEPFPRNLHYLREHVRMNDLKNVDVFDAAVSDRGGTARFQEGPGTSMGKIADRPGDGSIEVRVVALDELASEGRIPPPTIVKIDVEGAEYGVLRGAETLLRNHRPVIFLATHGDDVHQQCCDFLRSIGYTLRGLPDGDPSQTDELIATFPA